MVSAHPQSNVRQSSTPHGCAAGTAGSGHTTTQELAKAERVSEPMCSYRPLGVTHLCHCGKGFRSHSAPLGAVTARAVPGEVQDKQQPLAQPS